MSRIVKDVIQAIAESVDIKRSSEKPLAVIIKGNMDRLKTNSIHNTANLFYNDIKKQLEMKGYRVEFDAGLPYTIPNENAVLWLGHSRGADRLRFAPKHIETFEIKGRSNFEDKDINANDPEHFVLSDRDINFIKHLGI